MALDSTESSCPKVGTVGFFDDDCCLKDGSFMSLQPPPNTKKNGPRNRQFGLVMFGNDGQILKVDLVKKTCEFDMRLPNIRP